MEMNWVFSVVKDPITKKPIWEGNEKTNIFTRDIHFKELPANYDRLVRMTIEVVERTQFLGNLVDVAKMEGAELDDSTHFPEGDKFGARRANTETTTVSSGARAFASTSDVPMKLATVKEEEDTALTLVAVRAYAAGFARTPCRGDKFKSRPHGFGAGGGTLHKGQGLHPGC